MPRKFMCFFCNQTIAPEGHRSCQSCAHSVADLLVEFKSLTASGAVDKIQYNLRNDRVAAKMREADALLNPVSEVPKPVSKEDDRPLKTLEQVIQEVNDQQSE